ncbi:P-loop containing nucleoside triphosphate hydrolase protein [Amylostereum chailletii]|nr:P-loop containing nucleoside triphosphate hydrolase protein [Amylostereum chailletii]
MPLLFDETSIVVVVTALKILGQQNVDALAKFGISAVAVSSKNNDEKTFKDIKEGRHRFVVVNPEVLMKKDGHFEDLWKCKSFTDRFPTLTFDEAHCISTWGTFRPQYKEIQRLRYLLPSSVHYCLFSATLSPPVLGDISNILNLNQSNTEYYVRPNDRPNVFLVVEEMKHPISSFHDLDFAVPIVDGVGCLPPWKFIIFFDKIKEAEAACEYLQSRLPPDPEKRNKLIWFHSIMSDTYREKEAAALAIGERVGACGTDSLGMGVDIPDIRVIIQWRLTCTMEALWQRFGRAARDPSLEGVAIIFVPPKELDKAKPGPSIGRPTAASKKRKREDETSTTNLETLLPVSYHDLALKKQATSLPSTPNVPIAVGRGESLSASTVGGGRSQVQVQLRGETVTEAPVPSGGPSSIVQPKVSAPSDNDLRFKYHRKAEIKQAWQWKPEKKVDDQVDEAMNDFVNAHTRGFGCRRTIPRVYFGGVDVSDHLHCLKTDPLGCPRCRPTRSRLCCDICTPSLLTQMGISLTSTPLPRPSETKSHSAIRKKDPTATENDLQAKLQSWQKTTAKAIYSHATYRKHGPFFLISDENLDRIVVCAQMKKIKSVADIAREMCWNEANTHGAAILAIINEVYAPPVTAPPPHTGVDIDMGGSSVVVRDQIKRAPPTCSTCGTMGHTSRNRNCPGKIATTSTASVAVSPVTADVRSTPTHITFPPPHGHVFSGTFLISRG